MFPSHFYYNMSRSNVNNKLITGIGILFVFPNSLLNLCSSVLLLKYIPFKCQEEIDHWDWNLFGFPLLFASLLISTMCLSPMSNVRSFSSVRLFWAPRKRWKKTDKDFSCHYYVIRTDKITRQKKLINKLLKK